MKSLVMLLFTINYRYGDLERLGETWHALTFLGYRAGIDQRLLPVKFGNSYYCLGCGYGIYLAGEIECVSAEFPELENIPGSQISLTEASRLQSSATSVNALCHCKSGCINTDVHVEEQELSLSFPRNCTNNDL